MAHTRVEKTNTNPSNMNALHALSYIIDRLATYSTILYLTMITPHKYVKNWTALYLTALLGRKSVSIAKDGTLSAKISARKLFKCLVATEYIYRRSKVPQYARKISFNNTWMKIYCLNGSCELKVQPEKILMVSIPEVFNEIYNVNVRGMVVLDVGAYVGDSALYWLYKGARKVIAVEPVPEHYESLLENAKGKPIVAINASVGQKIPLLPNQVGLDTYGLISSEKTTMQHLDVPVYKLLELVETWKPDVVKMNFEGCEYAVINEIVQLPSYGVKIIIVQFHKKKERSMHRALLYAQKYLGPPKITESIFTKNPRITCIWATLM
ncbi:MAG: FkbM family methyltransferase [Nitrososphaerota archaeon]